MKKTLVMLIIVIIFMSSCASSNQMITTKSTWTATASPVPPTSTATKSPPVPTFTPSPTLSMPVDLFTPRPSSDTKITTDNLGNLQEVARYYGEMYFTIALSGDHKLLFVRDPLGVDIYDFQTSKRLNHIDLLGSPRWGELQVSGDGEWALVDQHALVQFVSEKEHQIQDLNSLFPMKKGNRYREVHLSPDGHKFMIVEFRCDSNGCVDDRVELINLPDMQIFYSWNNGSYLNIHGWNAVFSPDGSRIAARIDNQIVIWQTSDQKQVAAIKNIQGNPPVMFSSDGSLIAIGQLDTVQIWDVASGEEVQIIKGLCGELNNPPQPIFLETTRVVVLECPRSRKGIVTGWSVPNASSLLKRRFGDINLSRIVFEEDKDEVTVLNNPRKVGPWVPTNNPNVIQFMQNGDLAFQADAWCIINSSGKADCLGNTLLGTDDEFYAFQWQDKCIEFYRGLTSSGNPAYSVCSRGFIVNVIDPINNLLFSTEPSRGLVNSAKSVVSEMADNRTIAEWQGSEIEQVTFSGDKTFAAVCTRPGGAIVFDVVNRDKLTLIDLSTRTVVYKRPFTCLNMPRMVLTKDGGKLITADAYIGKYGYTRHKLLIMNTSPPIEQQIFDIGCDNLNALTLSPDESMLVIACTDGTLRFLHPDTAEEIYRQVNIDPDIGGLAFSKDGSMLAMASRRGFISEWAIPPFSFNP